MMRLAPNPKVPRTEFLPGPGAAQVEFFVAQTAQAFRTGMEQRPATEAKGRHRVEVRFAGIGGGQCGVPFLHDGSASTPRTKWSVPCSEHGCEVMLFVAKWIKISWYRLCDGISSAVYRSARP